MICNDIDDIERCNLTNKVGMVLSESEQVILFMTVGNDNISARLQFMNGVSTRFSKTILSC